MYENLMQCLDQKIVLLTRVYDLSSQMEALSGEADFDLGLLPQQRQVFLERLQKCDALIGTLSAKLPPEAGPRAEAAIRGKIKKEDCSNDELPLFQSGTEIRSLLRRILASDEQTRGRVQAQCMHLGTLLRSSRSSGYSRLPDGYGREG